MEKRKRLVEPEYMEEIQQLTCNKLQKCSTSRRLFMADCISALPDDILVIILSLLTMKEAARTSILSHRWKNLWTFATGSLDFDGSKQFYEIDFSKRYELLGSERVKFIRWVNQILNAHKGATIDALRVRFDFDLSFGSDIDSWINFAIQKRVNRLELDFERLAFTWDSCYPFPEQSLGNSNIKCLTSLNFQYVDVTQEVLEYFLSHCPYLEFVRISASPCLVGLKVLPASSPKLKHLEIVHCHCVKFLEISAVNLTTLKYSGPKTELLLKNVPNLAALSFGGLYSESVIRHKNIRRLSISLSQIAKLKLDLGTKLSVHFRKFPTFENLKQLELVVKARDHHSLLSCTSLLRACPLLYRFSIQFEWRGKPKLVRKREGKKHILLKCLKVVEMRHFRGSTTDVELATYLFTNAHSLDIIIVDTRDPYRVGTPFEVLDKENVTAKDLAVNLASKLSPGAELQVL